MALPRVARDPRGMREEFEWDRKKATAQRILVVCHTYRGDVVRLISARRFQPLRPARDPQRGLPVVGRVH